MFDVSDSVDVEDKVMLVARPDLTPVTGARSLLAWGETSRDECVLVSVRHGSQQLMGQWVLTRHVLCSRSRGLSGGIRRAARVSQHIVFTLILYAVKRH